MGHRGFAHVGNTTVNQMVIILDTPLHIQTKGNLRVEISGIDPGARHPIKGFIHSPEESIDASWDEDGFCLDNLPDCNLKVDDPGLASLIETTLKASPCTDTSEPRA